MNQLRLRPTSFDEFIGQEKLVATIKTMISGAKYRNEVLDHILFSGSPGTGKTSLASIIGNEMQVKIHFLQGSMLEKKSDILSVFANVKHGDIVFIDEIHSVNKGVEELIYNAMEDYKIDIVIGPEGNSKAMRMNLNPFTLIGATTKLNLISQPFKDRFGFLARMSNYKLQDIENVIRNSANILNIKIDNDVEKIIALYSKRTPRVANHLLKRIYDFSIQEHEKSISKETSFKTFKHLDLYDLGLNRDHIEYLKVLKDTFDLKFASLDSIAGIINQEKDNIISEIEPILLSLKLIQKGPRGRRITSQGIDYLLRNSISLNS
ncbi:Holliday junction branch migration DNA helicase RuvB [Mycoplasma sp. Mirounga ES2805-ORL]|uniref:Holliday junction branch migration DNA helicase RuvB n=1 Tax=Mycoplasma sp. Mirounga ES2805-ORL TaxID=754514 RepID=UPI00197C84E5|nr:Holliday junction branch migration DNA helicase RuvB [Mycoplasma sp. Mirounga ES2805-ORL]QSF13686.1 Holliday junction branch migration DNA helicase RuvB [Mycoplasma sp. Mirounga ES2805-ORL]